MDTRNEQRLSLEEKLAEVNENIADLQNTINMSPGGIIPLHVLQRCLNQYTDEKSRLEQEIEDQVLADDEEEGFEIRGYSS